MVQLWNLDFYVYEISISIIYILITKKKLKGEYYYMSKRVQLSNLVEAIEIGMISVTKARSETKVSMDITDVDQIEPKRFIESIDLLNKTIFGDSIDFFYKFTEEHTMNIECKIRNVYMEECFYAECSIKDGISSEDVNAKFRETIFDRMDKKLKTC